MRRTLTRAWRHTAACHNDLQSCSVTTPFGFRINAPRTPFGLSDLYLRDIRSVETTNS